MCEGLEPPNLSQPTVFEPVSSTNSNTPTFIFLSLIPDGVSEKSEVHRGDIKNHLHIELSNFLEKSRVPAEVVTTDEWNFESIASTNSTIRP